MSERPVQVPFQAHIELLQSFLAHRDQIVVGIQELLNAQRKLLPTMRDRSLLSRHIEDCFFSLPAVSREQAALKGQLREAHRASGFRPSQIPGMHNDLVDPAEMMIRGFSLWQRTRWPGRNARVRYAQTLFNLHVVQCLELVIMRLWDAGPDHAGERLAQVQDLLDSLWKGSPADQPVLVRDARWLIALAQSPGNEQLAPYFEVAERIAQMPSEADRIEINKAAVQLAGGHLRSQLRHYILANGESLGDNSLILRTRRSNALDFSMTVQSLVPLLKAYEQACDHGAMHARRELAGTICQGISPDPDLFVNRVDLLGAYSMIEYLFTAVDRDGRVAFTPMGQRHVRLLQEYTALINRVSGLLYEDCAHFRPLAGVCCPYGVMYGFSNNLLEHMAIKAMQPDAVTGFSLEDVFTESDAGAARLAWVSGWRKLPHIDPQVQKLYDYPQQFAEAIFERMEQALRRRAGHGAATAAARTGRLFSVSGDEPRDDSNPSQLPELPVQYVLSSDAQIVAANKATSCDQSTLLHDRHEGMFLVSYQTPGGWSAIAKDLLTDVLGAGRDVKITGLPEVAAAVLRLTCPDLVAQSPLSSFRDEIIRA